MRTLLAAEPTFQPQHTHSDSELSYVVQFFLSLHFFHHHLPLLGVLSVGGQVLLSTPQHGKDFGLLGSGG